MSTIKIEITDTPNGVKVDPPLVYVTINDQPVAMPSKAFVACLQGDVAGTRVRLTLPDVSALLVDPERFPRLIKEMETIPFLTFEIVPIPIRTSE